MAGFSLKYFHRTACYRAGRSSIVGARNFSTLHAIRKAYAAGEDVRTRGVRPARTDVMTWARSTNLSFAAKHVGMSLIPWLSFPHPELDSR